MFPRNFRKAYAWKIAKILALFSSSVAEGGQDKDVQRKFISALKQANLQVGRENETRDPNPGDYRTYRAQMSGFGFVFQREDSPVCFTKAGRDILDGVPALKVLQTQVIRHQYPSVYSRSRNVEIDAAIRLRPFVFLLRLMKEEKLGRYITSKEGAVAVACAKTERDHDLVVDLILRSRAGEDLGALVKLGELRTAKTSEGEVTLAALNDISNTMVSGVLGGCMLVVEDGKVDGKARYVHNAEFQDVIDAACTSAFSEIPNADNDESFQRAYGAWDVKKDTAVADPSSGTVSRREGPEVGMIKALYFDFQGDEGIGLAGVLSPKFVEQAKAVLGVSEAQVRKALESYLRYSMQESERDFIRISAGGTTTAMAFEKKIRAIFQDDFSITAYHTGQQKPRGRLIGGFADVLLVFQSPLGCVILDAKSTPMYSFPASDCRAMKDYCAYFSDMPDAPKGAGLLAAGFVSCSFSSGAPSRLKEISSNVGVPVFALSADVLLGWIKSGQKGKQVLDSMLALAPA
jgi:hypothetical protein